MRNVSGATFAARYGPWAIVVGASEGLGATFATELAARGLNLLLLARRAAPLGDLASQLRSRTGVDVRCEACDVARDDLWQVIERTTEGLDIGLIVFNAAHAPVGEFVQRTPEDLHKVIDVNVRGPLTFVRALAPRLVARKRGGIVLMSSMAGNQGAPRIATYAASKSFNTVLAEGLWHELRPHGVDVIACCAGAIRTPGYAASAGKDAPGTLDAGEVAVQTLNALGHGPVVVPGVVNRIARFVLGRVLPRRTSIGIFANSTKDLS